jgi:hypothetical protein
MRELNAFWPLSCIAGEGGERSETGEGFVAAQILFQRGMPEPRDGRGGAVSTCFSIAVSGWLANGEDLDKVNDTDR